MRLKMETILERDGLDVANVQCWEGRPRRTRRPPPKTYWEEYVETDPWFVGALLEDVPEDEIRAACFDEDFAEGEGEESEEELESEGEDGDYEPCEVSDDCGESYEDESAETTGSEADSGEEEVHGSSEGERGSEAEDGEGPRGPVG